MHISYAPLQPSYRRDRTTEIGYSDCSFCNGDGRIYTGYYSYSKHYKYCETCYRRYYAEPKRAAYIKEKDRLHNYLKTAAANAYSRNLELRYPEYILVTPKRYKVKGKGRTKMFHRKRNVMWKVGFLRDVQVPDEVRLAIDNTAKVYYGSYEYKKDKLDKRLYDKYPEAAEDMKRIDHPLYNMY